MGEEDCMMSPKNVCIGGYIFGDIIIMGVYDNLVRAGFYKRLGVKKIGKFERGSILI